MTPSTPTAVRLRFWITVVCFALANLGIWAWYANSHRPQRRDLLRVERFDPPGTLGKPKLVWKFNLDIQPRRDGAAPAVIAPPLPGRFQWQDARTLTFLPDGELHPGSHYTLTIPADRIASTDGFRLSAPFVSEFSTGSLQLLDVRQSAIDDDKIQLEATFNDAVLPADLQQHLGITTLAGSGSTSQTHVPASVLDKQPSRTIKVLVGPLPHMRTDSDDCKLRFWLSAGLAGVSGPLGIPQSFGYDVSVSPRLMAMGLSAHSPAMGPVELSLEFNGKAAADLLRKLVSVEPAVPFTISGDGHEAKLSGDFQPGTRYAVKIAAPPAGSDERQFPRPTVLSAFIPDRTASLWLDHTDGYLGSAGNRLIMAHATNVARFKVEITRVYDNNIVSWHNSTSRWSWRNRNPESYSEPVASEVITLAREKNKPQQIPLSLDELLPPSAPRDGVYRVALLDERTTTPRPPSSRFIRESDDDDTDSEPFVESASALVTLSDIALSAKQTRDAVYIWAVSLSKGTPLGQVRVRVYSDKNQTLGEAITDENGLARIGSLVPAAGEKASIVLAERLALASPATRPATLLATMAALMQPPQTRPALAQGGRDLTWLDLQRTKLNLSHADIGGDEYLRKGHEAFVYTERGVYRPGETVHLRAIVRGPDLSVPPAFPVRWQLERPDRIDWKSSVVTLDADGACAFDVELPADLPTGRWKAHLQLPGDVREHFGAVSFLVEDYMPDRIKASLSLQGDEAAKPADGVTPRVLEEDGPLTAVIQADYLFGLPASGLSTDLAAIATPVSFEHAAWKQWTFGDSARLSTKPSVSHRKLDLEAITLDAKGHGTAEVEFDKVIEGQSAAPTKHVKHAVHRQISPASKAPDSDADADNNTWLGPWRLLVSASVHEIGGRAVTTTDEIIVDRIPRYLGLRRASRVITPGTTTPLELALVTPSGGVVEEEATVNVEVFRENWNNSLVFRDGRYRWDSTRVLDSVAKATPVAMVKGRGIWRFTPPQEGNYLICARDPETGFCSTIELLAASGAWEESISREHPEQLELLVTRSSVTPATRPSTRPAEVPQLATPLHPGEKATVVVRSPFAGTLLLSIETDDVIMTQVLEMKASQVSVPIEITDACRPNAYICATVVRKVDANGPWRTHRAFGVRRLPVDCSDRRLAVEVKTPKEIRPIDTLPVGVRVTDASGKPVANSAVTVTAVDEGILQLTGYETPSPFAFFTAPRALRVQTGDIYDRLMPEVTKPAGQQAVGGDGGDELSALSPVTARRVRPVAMVSAILHTNADGIATTDFRLPEFLGKVHVSAVAHHARGVGSGESDVLDRTPIIVQSSWPRFCAPGDRFKVPVTIINNLTEPSKIDLAILCLEGDASPLSFTGNAPGKLTTATKTLEPGTREIVWVEMLASAAIGVVHLDLTATAHGESYHEVVEIPVRPASPAIVNSDTKAIVPGEPATFRLPNAMLPGTERLKIMIAPKPSLELPRALESLSEYPYGCCEQTISKCLPLLYARDIREQLGDSVFDPASTTMAMQHGIFRVLSMQTASGGLAMWPGGSSEWPWGSVYGLHFFVEARTAGYAVPESAMDRLAAYVRGLLASLDDDGDRLELNAYACYALALAGKPERDAMRRLDELLKKPAANGSESATQARFHLAGAWLAAGRGSAAEQLLPPIPPLPRKDRQLEGNLGSPARDIAVALNTFLQVRPDHPAIPKLAEQLAAMGRNGQWYSTQDTAFAAMALGRYLRQSKNEQPYTTADLLVGGQSVAHVDGSQTLRWSAPATRPVGEQPLEIRLTGPATARGYVTWVQSGTPSSPVADSDKGMEIRRAYLMRDRRPLDMDRVRSGDIVLVELTIRTPIALPHIVIADLLPAGLEIENPRLETTEKTDATQPDKSTAAPGFENPRLDIRDDRMILVDQMKQAGEARYTYVARAVTAGTFTVPPVHAECMYDSGRQSTFCGAKTLTVLPTGAVTETK